MSTTTLRLPEDLKQRIMKLAAESGMSVHSFMVEAIARKADEAELQAAFHKEADARFQELMTSGDSIDWREMKAWLQARASGKSIKVPKTRKWRA
jgi:predicted transcriptional regulator